MREGLQWKAHSHEGRVARTWNGKPDPQGHAQHTKPHSHNADKLPLDRAEICLNYPRHLLCKKGLALLFMH